MNHLQEWHSFWISKKKVFSIPMFNFLKKRSRTYYKLSLKEALSIMDMFHLSKTNKLKTGLWFMVSFIIMKKRLKHNLPFLTEFKPRYTLNTIVSKHHWKNLYLTFQKFVGCFNSLILPLIASYDSYIKIYVKSFKYEYSDFFI